MPNPTEMNNKHIQRTCGQHIKRPPGPGDLGTLVQARDDPLRFALDLARKYGDISYFKIGTYTGYLLNHPDYFQHVLSTNHRNYNKENYNYEKLKPVLGDGLITSSGERWQHSRQLIQPVFHHRSIEHFGQLTIRNTREMLDQWKSHARVGRKIDLSREMMQLTLRIITESLFGIDIRASAHIVEKAFTTLNRDISYRFRNVLVAPLWVPTPRNRKFLRARDQLDRLVYDIIQKRRRDRSQRNDLLSQLLNSQHDTTGRELTDEQLRDEVMTLMLAGHETTANLLTWTFHLLSLHPEALQKLRAELDDNLRDHVPSVPDLSSLSWLTMVLKESLRLYPPVWIISRNAIGRDAIGGYPIPAGSTVTLCSYALHRHPDFWEEPEVFRPERFSPDQHKQRHKFSYVPFGGGPRSCIGQHLAMTEAQLILSLIFQRYHLKPASRHEMEPDPLVTLRPRNSLKMKIEFI